MEDFSRTPRHQAERAEHQSTQLETLTQALQDTLEQDDRYRNRDKPMRAVPAEWQNSDGMSFLVRLEGTHIYTPEKRYLGQQFELVFQVGYAVGGSVVPGELTAQAENDDELLPPREDILGVDIVYEMLFSISPLGSFGWEEHRTYEVASALNDEKSRPDEILDEMEDPDTPDGPTIMAFVSEYVVHMSQRTDIPDDHGGARAANVALSALGIEFDDIEQEIYVEYATQMLEMLRCEDEGGLELARVFPPEVVVAIKAA